MAVTYSLTAGTVEAGFCPVDYQDILEEFALRLTLILPDYYASFVISITTPAAEDQDKVWLKLDGAGDPIGFFFYVGGIWTQIDAPNVHVGLLGGSTNNYTLTVANYPSTSGPRTHDVFIVKVPVSGANTAASTLNLNGLGTKPIMSGGVALWAGALESEKWYTMVFDGTNYEVEAIRLFDVTSIPGGNAGDFLRTRDPGTGVETNWEAPFVGAEQGIPGAGSSASFSHGLTTTPISYSVRLRCKTIDLGYAVGDEVDLHGLFLSTTQIEQPAFAVMANATTIIAIRNSAVTTIQMINKSTGSDAGTITEGSWRVVAYAIR